MDHSSIFVRLMTKMTDFQMQFRLSVSTPHCMKRMEAELHRLQVVAFVDQRYQLNLTVHALMTPNIILSAHILIISTRTLANVSLALRVS